MRRARIRRARIGGRGFELGGGASEQRGFHRGFQDRFDLVLSLGAGFGDDLCRAALRQRRGGLEHAREQLVGGSIHGLPFSAP
jgi:hypothetical protein